MTTVAEPDASRSTPSPGQVLAAAAHPLRIALDTAGGCQAGLTAREGDLEALTDAIAAAQLDRGAPWRQVVIDQAVDLRRRLAAHHEQAAEVLRRLHAAAELLEEWVVASTYCTRGSGGDDRGDQLAEALRAATSSAATAASGLNAAAHALAPTARALEADAALLATARSSTGMCLRFTLTGHGALTQLIEEIEHAGHLCTAAADHAAPPPGLRLVQAAGEAWT